MHHTYMVGNFLPIAVYGSIILFLVVVNPLLYLISQKLTFSGAELAVAMALTLTACCIPSSGLLRTFSSTLVMPYQLNKTNPGWQDNHALTLVPPAMLVDANGDENTVVGRFIQGSRVKSDGANWLAARVAWFQQVPWERWTRTLKFWVPLILLLWLGLLGLSLVIHRQWSDHEHLPYPIATFTHALLPAGKQLFSETIRSRLFWLSAIIIMLIHFNNYLGLWCPGKMVTIPYWMTVEYQKYFPLLAPAWWLWNSKFYFSVVAFAFFLATDVSLALGIGPILWTIFSMMLAARYGISVGAGSANDPSITNHFQFGAYLGMLLVLLYTGRRYYTDAFHAAFGGRTRGQVSRESIWGARLFLAAMIAFNLYLIIGARLDWQLAALYSGCTVMIFLVMSRILAETGVFFIQANIYPTAIFLGFMGASALGPRAVAVVALLSVVLLLDPREAFMPFIVNALKLVDMNRVSVGKVAGWAAVALGLGMAIALPVTLGFQYNHGANMQDAWATQVSPSMSFDTVVRTHDQLKAQGLLEQASALSGWARFLHLSPNPTYLWAFAIGLVLMLLFTVGRIRFTYWPIHPVIFLMWTTFPADCFAPAFLLGWVIKALTMRFGGSVVYRNLKPLMIGVIAGEMTAGVIMMLIGGVYFLITHQPPKTMPIMPG